MSKQPNYRQPRMCKNCAFSEIRPVGRDGGFPIGHWCKRYDCRCCTTKVCDSHKYYAECDDAEIEFFGLYLQGEKI